MKKKGKEREWHFGNENEELRKTFEMLFDREDGCAAILRHLSQLNAELVIERNKIWESIFKLAKMDREKFSAHFKRSTGYVIFKPHPPEKKK